MSSTCVMECKPDIRKIATILDLMVRQGVVPDNKNQFLKMIIDMVYEAAILEGASIYGTVEEAHAFSGQYLGNLNRVKGGKQACLRNLGLVINQERTAESQSIYERPIQMLSQKEIQQLAMEVFAKGVQMEEPTVPVDDIPDEVRKAQASERDAKLKKQMDEAKEIMLSKVKKEDSDG